MIASTVSGNQYTLAASPSDTVSQMASDAGLTAPKSDTQAPVGKNANIENLVRTSFSDTPILAEVAKCESHFTQYTGKGNVFRGEVNPYDVGVMQINELYHLERSKKLGFDIYTPEGNIGYARFLYEKQGTRPWSASKPCWGKYETPSKIAIAKVN